MADAKIVKQKLRNLLKEVDFDTATQRSITQTLEQELEVNLSQHKPMIKVGGAAGGWWVRNGWVVQR